MSHKAFKCSSKQTVTNCTRESLSPWTYIFCKANVLLFEQKNSRLFYNISIKKSFIKKCPWSQDSGNFKTLSFWFVQLGPIDLEKENSGPTFLYIYLTQVNVWSPANECQYIHFDGNP